MQDRVCRGVLDARSVTARQGGNSHRTPPANQVVKQPIGSPGRGVAWAVMSFAAYVAALFAILPVLAVINWFTDVPHMTEMAAWSVVWGGLSLIGVLIAARVAFGAWLPFNAIGIATAVIGIALSAIVHVVLQQWEIAVTRKVVGEFRRRSRSLAREEFDDLIQDCLAHWIVVRQKL